MLNQPENYSASYAGVSWNKAKYLIRVILETYCTGDKIHMNEKKKKKKWQMESFNTAFLSKTPQFLVVHASA